MRYMSPSSYLAQYYKKELQNFSPILAGRLALSTAVMTPAEKAAEMGKILGFNKETEDDPDDR